VLDEALWTRLSAWPQIFVALMDRILQRSRSASLRLAIVQLPQLSSRLSLLLWHLADRYGHVEAQDTVHLPLRLSHSVLAELVSAQRPSVSSALKRLDQDGTVVQYPDRTFLLRGRPQVLHASES